MTPQRRLMLGLLLTACAGFIDVVGFIELGGYFTSFMSGNTTQLGAAIGGMEQLVALPAGLVAMFFGGSFIGAFLGYRSRRWGPSMVLAFVIATLGVALALRAAGWPAAQAMMVLAAGAGAQNATLPFSGSGARLGATFVTGTLFAAGQDLAAAILGKAPPWRWLQQLQVWTALLVGGLAGALLYGRFGLEAILAPGLIYLVMMIGFALKSPAGQS
ncbi:Uncharacterized membrane protein YoaK, UPF0700 family [Devosia enhydra]|uniref:Uncharacterized membrane protein YoaK, UPF0700 family n=1 Tax=Devosia enhydra TaxID=665118 RepID=A0A1K2HU83_9HYPH|nr:YoaK family protein [Devosia enhydra]SFZ81930.1 Uncharacterized membrane protein YoaK, UPF0700 family [Devosia enhydra]